MLFSLDQNTPQCGVFRFLNNQLLEFLSRAVEADHFDSDLFAEIDVDGVFVQNVCWANEPTKEKFEALWVELNKAGINKEAFHDLARSSQNIQSYFDDRTVPLAQIQPESLFEALKSLTSHLYIRTKDLADAKTQSNSSIELHYQSYLAANQNSSLCYLCGTMQLSQNRDGLDDEEQWRSDYDHLLCKDKYPLFSVHPGNFIPTCHICNSKAKGARNLLMDASGARRLAFYSLPPSTESCHSFVKVRFTLKDLHQLTLNNELISPTNAIEINFDGMSPVISGKIAVWEEVYKLSGRVKSEIDSSLIDRISSDLRPRDYADFKYQLERFATTNPADIKHAVWRFWWQKLYEFLHTSSDDFLQHLWGLIQYKQNITQPNEMQNTFGI